MQGFEKKKKAGALFTTICLITLLLIPLSIATPADTIKTDNESNIQIWTQTLTFSPPEIRQHQDSLLLSIAGAEEITSIPNQPCLPYTHIVKTFPLGTTFKEINCMPSDTHILNLQKPLQTAPPITWHHSAGPSPMIQESTEVKKQSYCQYQTGGGLHHGEHVTFLSLQLYPAVYHQNTETVEYVEELTVTVEYIEPIKQPTYEQEYSFVIISPSTFTQPLEKLVSHKTQRDLSTTLVTLEEIYNGDYFPTEGYDEAEQIKMFIKNACEQWNTTYVLLVGSIKNLPLRAAWFGDWKLLTDLYYADLYFGNHSFCSWDSNENHIFGEYWHDDAKDHVDLYPDVYLGRIACSNLLDVRIVVNKIITYETADPGDWWDDIILLGGDTFPGWGVFEGEITNQCIANALADFDHIKLWTSQDTFTPDNILRKVNKGARFIEYSGHGYQNGIGTSPPNNPERIEYFTRNLVKLTNGNKLPVIFFDACLTAKLDATVGEIFGYPDFFKIPFPAFAWHWVKKIGGGAIASVGATEVAYSSVDSNGPQAGAGCLSLYFFESCNSCTTVSEMLVSAQNTYLNSLWKDHWTIEQFILLGDPTLRVGDASE